MRAATILASFGVLLGLSACGSAAKRVVYPPVPIHPDRAYAVSTPPDMSSGGGAVLKPAACRLASIYTAATTRASTDGVLGLVTLIHHGCTIEVDAGSVRLIGSGKPAPVKASVGNPTNVAASKRPDFAEYAGNVRVGFAWTGSYCGPPVASVQLRVNGHPLQVPLRGPVPVCHSPGLSYLIPGTISTPTSPVEPAPVSWKGLRAQVVLPATLPRKAVPLTVVLTNTTHADISLADPCPYYNETLTLGSGGSGPASVLEGSGGDLCRHPVVVQPGKPVTLHLGTQEFPSVTSFPTLRVATGDTITVTWTIAGVPTASATATVR